METVVTTSQAELEKKEILNRYRGLLRSCRSKLDNEDKKLIRKAFDIALEAHKNARRKSGEPYIYHPIAVARIVAEEIGLGAVAIACALLHDTVEDTDITLNDIEGMFGKKVASIIDGLTKISGVLMLLPPFRRRTLERCFSRLPKTCVLLLLNWQTAFIICAPLIPWSEPSNLKSLPKHFICMRL